MHHLRQAIHRHEDCIVAFGLRQLSDEVAGHHLPRTIGHRIRLQRPHRTMRRVLRPDTGVAPGHVPLYEGRQSGPPVIATHQLVCLPTSWMPSRRAIVVYPDHFPADILVLRHVDLPLEQQEAVLRVPLLQSLPQRPRRPSLQHLHRFCHFIVVGLALSNPAE